MDYIKPNDYLNEWGLSMQALHDFSGVSYRTLLNWYHGDKRQLFDIVVLGCLCEWCNISKDSIYKTICQ